MGKHDDEDEVNYAAVAADFLQKEPVVWITNQGKYYDYQLKGVWEPITEAALGNMVTLKTGVWNRKMKSALLMALEDTGKAYKNITYSFRQDLEKDLFNLMDVTGWILPEEGEHHALFDILMYSLGGGKAENIEYLERLILSKYLYPWDHQIPCTIIHGEGGVGKNLLVDIVLYHLFDKSTVSASVKNAVGDFNSIIQGMTVLMLNESKASKLDGDAMKGWLGQPRIIINEKGIKQYAVDNMAMVFISSQSTTGGIFLDRSDADRRYSVLYCPKGHTLDSYIATAYNITLPEAKLLRQSAIETVYGNKLEIGKWLGYLLMKHGSKPSVRHLHGADFKRLMDIQERMEERMARAVFSETNEDGHNIFTHISRKTFYAGYILLCKEYNYHPVQDTKFFEGVREFITINNLPVEEVRTKDGRTLFRDKTSDDESKNHDKYITTFGYADRWTGPEV